MIMSDMTKTRLKLSINACRKECPTDFDKRVLPRSIIDRIITEEFGFAQPFVKLGYSEPCHFSKGKFSIPLSLNQVPELEDLKRLFTRIQLLSITVWYYPKIVDPFDSPYLKVIGSISKASDYLKMKSIYISEFDLRPVAITATAPKGTNPMRWNLMFTIPAPLLLKELSALGTFYLIGKVPDDEFGTVSVSFDFRLDTL